MRFAGPRRRDLPPLFIPAGSGNPPALDYESWFRRTRDELPQVHIPQSEAGKPVKAQRRFKEFDDAWDTMRAIAASLPTL